MFKLPLYQCLFKLVINFTVVCYTCLLHHLQVFHYFAALRIILCGSLLFPLNNENLFFHLCYNLHKMLGSLAVRCHLLPQYTEALKELIKVLL
jgi:hypothetical protein